MSSRSTHRTAGIAIAPGPAGPGSASALPDEVDIWQAASLFVGLYGVRALHVAAARLGDLDEEAERDRQVWNRIIARIGELLCGLPAPERN
jgi:hypothetical protein